MVLVLLLTVASFIVIFVHADGYAEVSFRLL